jgi:hypothetical protein
MRAAILVVGSLLWRTSEQRRVIWRQEQLDLESKLGVGTPIYYGRLSQGGTYTMTFDGGDGTGRAVLVPCRAPVTTVDHLKAEAQELWKAEAREPRAGSISASWGCVGALFRRDAVRRLAAGWSNWFRQSRATAVAAVNAAGILGVPWPTGAEESDIEVILATSTMPTTPRATAQQMAGAWIANGSEEYFFRNVEHGIRTRDDHAVWRVMQERQAQCLTKADWARAIAILRCEAAGAAEQERDGGDALRGGPARPEG